MVQQWTGRHAVRNTALFRLVELVVHGRDLPSPVAPDAHALGLVVVALASALPAGLAVPPWVEGTGPTVEPLLLFDLATGRVPVPPGLGTVGESLPLLGWPARPLRQRVWSGSHSPRPYRHLPEVLP